MTSSVYERLADHLDHLPGGFPTTESGIELRILKRLFSEKDAEIVLHLNLLPEPPRVIARRAKMPVGYIRERLEYLSRQGCIFSVTPQAAAETLFPRLPTWIKRKLLYYDLKKDELDTLLYAACNFVIGIWEFHLKALDQELIADMNGYIPELIDEWIQAPQLRTIPVGKSLNGNLRIMDYEKAEGLIAKQKRIVVADCICRKETRTAGHGCQKPLETCLVFGLAADYYARNELGRPIDTQEALRILKKAEKTGLVLQPTNAKEVTNICCCCGCCCGVLRNIKKMSQPRRHVPSAYRAVFQPDACKGCGACVKRCPMEAFRLENDVLHFDEMRCIGCGLCTVTCTTGSLKLIPKPPQEIPPIPGDTAREYYEASLAKGKRSRWGFLKLLLQSRVDRLIA